MLQLTPEQAEALENVERTMFLQRLGAHLTEQWPAVAERLGERLPAFVDLAVQQAERHRLTFAVGVARFVNLCFLWGTSFEQKPGFEWAMDTLADVHRHEWLIVHQLVRRSIAALSGQNGPLPSPEALLEADTRLMQAFAGLGRMGRLLLREGLELPRVACDLDVADIRLVDPPPRLEYDVSTTGSSRIAAPPWPPSLRIDPKRPQWPELVSILAPRRNAGPPVRLQVRVAARSVCDSDWHPHVTFTSPHALWESRGHEARAISWLVSMPDSHVPDTDLGAAIAEETFPELSRLSIATCGLRDDGVPLGEGNIQVWVYPASQWLLEVAHSSTQPLTWPGPEVAPSGDTRVRLECDGVARDASAWDAGFKEHLGTALLTAMARLGGAWERTAGVTQAQVVGEASLLTGRAALTWGWREGDRSLSNKALLRFVADLDLMACKLDVVLTGQLALGGARATVRLRLQGEAPLRTRIAREGENPTLPVLMADTVSRFRIPFNLEVEPLATADAAVLNVCGPCSGALVGEAGLRPRVSGGSGWQWYVQLRIEPGVVPIVLHDPLIGQTQRDLPLLPTLPLLDWSLG